MKPTKEALTSNAHHQNGTNGNGNGAQRQGTPQLTRLPRERAVLVGLDITSADDTWHIDDSLDELERLADTAGLVVVGMLSQKLSHPNPKFYLGPGKINELAQMKEHTPYDVVVFDDELSPAQIRNIEDTIKARVIDRTTLILDIFASHARTREGALQVELAQYEYLLPRLRRQWTHLERQSGGGGGGSGVGVGLRGPGETQIETDRRIIRKRIAHLKEQLEHLHEQRQLYRQRRKKEGIPIVSLVGYTNAGKSTLLNRLTAAGVVAMDQLFATLDPTTRKVTLPGGRVVLVTDTVGFIQRLPHALVDAFKATLEELEEADLLLHVIDITHANAQEQAETVVKTLRELELQNTPVLNVLNKVDSLEASERAEIGRTVEEMELPGPYVPISAEQGLGIERMLATIEQLLNEQMTPVTAIIPYDRNDLVALWHERGVITEEHYVERGTLLRGRLPASIAGRYTMFVASPQEASQSRITASQHTSNNG